MISAVYHKRMARRAQHLQCSLRREVAWRCGSFAAAPRAAWGGPMQERSERADNKLDNSAVYRCSFSRWERSVSFLSRARVKYHRDKFAQQSIRFAHHSWFTGLQWCLHIMSNKAHNFARHLRGPLSISVPSNFKLDGRCASTILLDGRCTSTIF